MAGSAKRRKTYGNKLKDQTNDISTLYSLAGSKNSPTASSLSLSIIGGSSTPASIDEFQRLKTMGDSMIGAIAYYPKTTGIDVSGRISVVGGQAGALDDAYSSFLYLTGATNPDDLHYIDYPSNHGQVLIIQAVPTIVLKHNSNLVTPTGNIRIPSGSDFTMTPYSCATLIYSGAEGGYWTLIGSSPSLSWTGSATSDLDMNTYDIIDIDNLQFTADSGVARDNAKAGMYATDTSTVIINHGATKNFRLTEDGTYYVEFDEDELVPRLDDDYNLGTATKRWAAIHSHNFQCHTYLVMESGSAVDGSLIPTLDSSYDLGSSTKLMRAVYADKIQVTGDTITTGTSQTLQIPYLVDTTQYASGNTDLDADFGNQNGCVGIQFDTDESAGTGKYRFWIRADGAWYKAEAY